MRLAGKVAIITGGGAGIGRAMAERFAQEGAQVVIVEVDETRGEQVADAITAAGGEALFARTDIAKATEVAAMVVAAVKRFGGVDVLCNNAAVQLHGQDARAHDLSEEIWDRTYAINIKGAWLCAKYVLPHLIKRGGGSIIITGSPTGLYGVAPGYTAYSSSKAATFGLTRVMAADYARDHIRVNAIVPGTTQTPLIAELIADEARKTQLESLSLMGRLGTAEDVAAVAVFLASDEAAYCTGGYYAVDGGLTAI